MIDQGYEEALKEQEDRRLINHHKTELRKLGVEPEPCHPIYNLIGLGMILFFCFVMWGK